MSPLSGSLTRPYLLLNLRNYLWMVKLQLCVKQICLPSIISNVIQTTKVWTLKNCEANKFLKTQLKSVSIFFKFVHPCRLLYLLSYWYLLFMFWEVLFMSHSVCLTLNLLNRWFSEVTRKQTAISCNLYRCVLAIRSRGEAFSETLLNQNRISKTANSSPNGDSCKSWE